MNFDLKKFARSVKRYDADAWVVTAGSLEILKYLADEGMPVFAVAGRYGSLPIAGAKPDHGVALRAATNRLTALGHRRIVMVIRKIHRTPFPGRAVQVFLDSLAANNIPVSDFNLPDWEETPEGFHAMLKSLFQLTRPTAIIAGETNLFVAIQQFLGNQGLRVPQDVSLVCADYSPSLFHFCTPSITHFEFNQNHVTRYLLRWAESISQGKVNQRQYFYRADFIEGGTIGPAPDFG